MLKVYSKINIGLDIDPTKYSNTNKHKINSLFVLCKQFYDEIEITINNNGCDVVTYYQDDKNLQYSDCLVIKTLSYLRQRKLINNYYQIIIQKQIPSQSGLGGASSDAAGVIKYLVPDYLSLLDMQDVAINLGSDIPFFLFGYSAAIVSEFGDKVDSINLKTNLNIQIHLSPFQFSTKEVFACFDANKKTLESKNDFYKIINDLNNNIINCNINNDLLICAKQINQQWANFYNYIKEQHCFVIMSGSGGTIVSIDQPKRIRTRYAPSPTGYFHIGGARTAIFNYLYAKHYDGDFLVRIEDTDINREVENGIGSQLDNLEWLNIYPDESIRNPGAYGPYIQTQKLTRYQELAQKLIKEGKAYYCFCNEEKLEQDRQTALANHQTPRYARTCLHYSPEQVEELLAQDTPRVIRLKIDDNQEYAWNDLIRDTISIPGSAMTDPVILKSNNIPMYNFAVVVDDHDMLISHVLRGEEHISNTPYQIAIRDALGFDDDIQYGHLSVIVDETGKKLSKRNKEMKQFIEDYKLMGFPSAAVFNFLGLLSWTSPNNQEILSQEEFIQLFDIKNLSKSPTFFDFKKMLWISNEYMKKMTNDEYINFVKPFITIQLPTFLQDNFPALVLLFKNQISYATELNDLIQEQFLNNNIVLNEEEKHIIADNNDVVCAFQTEISKIQDWTIDNISAAINNVKTQTNKKGKDLFMPIRIAATGLTHGPEIAKVLYFTQQKTILDNIGKILK